MSRGDVIAIAYVMTVVAGITASLSASYINFVLTQFVTGLRVPGIYLPFSIVAYLARFMPTMIFATSLALLLYSVTPMKSGIPWVVMALYLIAVPMILILISGIAHNELAGKIALSALSPSYGFLELFKYALGITARQLAITCFSVSIASLILVTLLAITMFKAYGEVIL